MLGVSGPPYEPHHVLLAAAMALLAMSGLPVETMTRLDATARKLIKMTPDEIEQRLREHEEQGDD